MACNFVPNVVAVENIDPIRPGRVRAATLWTAPRVVGASLELSQDRRLCGSGLLESGVVIENRKVWRETIRACTLFRVAGPAAGVVVEASDVDVTTDMVDIVVLRPTFAVEVGVVEHQGNIL